MNDHARDHADRHGLGGPDELDVRSLASGTASASTYLRGDRTWATVTGGGTSDHGALTGLGDDDHTQYQLRSEKSAANGYPSLDGTTKVPIAELPTGSTSTTVCIGNDARLSDARTPTAHASTHGSAGADAITPSAIGAASSSDLTNHASDSTSIHGISDTANLVYTSDSRLSDARTPTAHKTTHATGGTDALAPADIGAIATSAIGTTVQGYDADLAAIAGLAPANDDFIQRKSGAWANRTISQVKTDLSVKPPSQTILTTSSSSPYTTPAGCTAILVEMVGGGGGGGGVTGAASQAAAAGGGAAGAYLRKFITSPSSSYTFSVGAAGTAATAGNNSGGAGGTTSFGTLSAAGGGGGSGMAAGTAVAISRGGIESTGASGGDFNSFGTDGLNGMRVNASANLGGRGGPNPFGGGGRAQDGNGAGIAASTPGTGGAGACSSNNATSRAGGAGAAGIIILTEFYG